MDINSVVKITMKVSKGMGFCLIKSRDTGKTYEANGPAYSIISDNEMAKLLITNAMKQFFDSEIRKVETAKPKQMTID